MNNTPRQDQNSVNPSSPQLSHHSGWSTFENWAGRVGSPEDVQCRNLLGRAGTKRVSL
jgi:hypothetical protein